MNATNFFFFLLSLLYLNIENDVSFTDNFLLAISISDSQNTFYLNCLNFTQSQYISHLLDILSQNIYPKEKYLS